MSVTDCFVLEKMSARIDGPTTTPKTPQYFIETGTEKLGVNQFIGKVLKLHFSGEIQCIHCHKKTKKSYSGGYCYPCSIKLAACDMCILRPETCHYQAGTCREPSWGETHCMIPHYVYLANSSGFKVGITRMDQIPVRWIDQGAVQAVPLLKVGTRYQSGVVEHLMKSAISDRTDWRAMLKSAGESLDLERKRKELFLLFGEDFDRLEEKFGRENFEVLEASVPTEIEYPVMEYPKKIVSVSPEKEKVIGGELLGIKGQYLIFPQGVINLRSYTGYKVQVEY